MTGPSKPYSMTSRAAFMASALAACLCALPAIAQDGVQYSDAVTPDPAAAQAGDDEIAIIVTGTRISGFDAPTPVTQLSQEEFEAKAINNLSQVLVEVPAFVANQNTGRTSQPVGASNLDLRGLGPSRTLLLVDGRRFAPTDPTGGVDINVIPTSLIKRVEVVTGGASAAYGSDAVSGVVNITLDDRFEGVKAGAQYGISDYGDVAEPSAYVAFGKALGDRFHVVGSFDYFDSAGQLTQTARPWGRDDWARLTNPAYPAAGEPRQIFSPNARFTQMTGGGVTALNSVDALKGIQFGPGGTVIPFNYGTNIGSTYMTGGDGGSLAYTANIMPEINRKSAFGRASYDLSDRLTLYADALWSKSKIFSNSTIATDAGNITITRQNAFLPDEIATIMDTNGLTSFRIGRIGFEEGESFQEISNEVQRYGIGVDGEFGRSWTWNAFAQLSINNYDRQDGNNRNNARFRYGVDSVMVDGTPMCRVTAENPGSTDPDIAQCVPINLFGAGSVTQDALDYMRGSAYADSQNGTAWLDSTQKQQVYAFSLSGPLVDLWAGPLDVAMGAEYRKDTIDAESDTLSQMLGWKFTNPQGVDASVSVKEAFVEAVLPVLRDSPLGQELTLNGAFRITDYSTSGSVNTWKLGATYTPTDFLRLRATYSSDIRAPSINELFSGSRQVLTTITNPITNEARSTLQFTGGNPDLVPERGKTFTAGAVITPAITPRLKLSADYYSIKITDAIVSLSGQNIVDGCLIRGQSSLCDAIEFDNAGTITSVSASLLNAASVETSGVDLELSYSIPVGAGDINLRALGTYIGKIEDTINGVTIDRVNNVGSSDYYPPNWRANFGLHYVSDNFSVGTFVRYVGGGKYNVTYEEGVDIDDNSIPSAIYVNLDGSIKPTDNFEIYARVLNLFDKDPPNTTNPITAPSYAASPFYDSIGRYYKIGVRVQF